jgi:hypothetical protein
VLLLCQLFTRNWTKTVTSFTSPHLELNWTGVRVRVTLRLMASQSSVCLGVKPRLGCMTRYHLLFDSYCLVLGRAPSLTIARVCRLSLTQPESESKSHIATDGQSVCLSWCWAPSGAHDQILVFDSYCLVLGRAPFLTRGRVCRLSVSQSEVLGQLQYVQFLCFTCVICYWIHIQCIQGLCQSGLSTADYAPFLVASL